MHWHSAAVIGFGRAGEGCVGQPWTLLPCPLSSHVYLFTARKLVVAADS